MIVIVNTSAMKLNPTNNNRPVVSFYYKNEKNFCKILENNNIYLTLMRFYTCPVLFFSLYRDLQ